LAYSFTLSLLFITLHLYQRLSYTNQRLISTPRTLYFVRLIRAHRPRTQLLYFPTNNINACAIFCFFVWISYIRQRYNDNDFYQHFTPSPHISQIGRLQPLSRHSEPIVCPALVLLVLVPGAQSISTSTSISSSEPKSLRSNNPQQCSFDYYLHLLQSSCLPLPSSSPYLSRLRRTRGSLGHHLLRASGPLTDFDTPPFLFRQIKELTASSFPLDSSQCMHQGGYRMLQRSSR